MSGLGLLRTVRTLMPDLPIILISGLCGLITAQGALRAGATDCLLKPVRPADLLEVVAAYAYCSFAAAWWNEVKETLMRSLGTRARRKTIKPGQLLPIFDSLGLKRVETLQHSRRVAAYALLIGRELGLERAELRTLELDSLLHNIRKAGIPRNVLLKPRKLTDAEWAVMKMHPQLGLDPLHGMPGESQIV
jgi:response regulator RpfG family c-di-GMP phosphodiesterase